MFTKQAGLRTRHEPGQRKTIERQPPPTPRGSAGTFGVSNHININGQGGNGSFFQTGVHSGQGTPNFAPAPSPVFAAQGNTGLTHPSTSSASGSYFGFGLFPTLNIDIKHVPDPIPSNKLLWRKGDEKKIEDADFSFEMFNMAAKRQLDSKFIPNLYYRDLYSYRKNVIDTRHQNLLKINNEILSLAKILPTLPDSKLYEVPMYQSRLKWRVDQLAYQAACYGASVVMKEVIGVVSDKGGVGSVEESAEAAIQRARSNLKLQEDDPIDTMTYRTDANGPVLCTDPVACVLDRCDKVHLRQAKIEAHLSPYLVRCFGCGLSTMDGIQVKRVGNYDDFLIHGRLSGDAGRGRSGYVNSSGSTR
ncbi:hypothetical protein HK097_011597 [Rhizophlyctis rosea]|uniref:Uncharacterized protein n=1 Tax=Rhizophlyctis rosea TaxID=64517 RepID=A0AAD5X2Z3_9FUNG|nr:hypothetical protein HK097_011597 [Rhizophlyctis rosea]